MLSPEAAALLAKAMPALDAVRGYLLGDGNVSLQQVEAARAATKAAIAKAGTN